ncbi:MAG TPA: SEC-C metal-binding domain-containing protein, partial [Tepidiformaceae bacterium]|nr:SEC-C metal-binding domain-containing protein [Tepidiformaceae bacterium]
NEHRIVIYGERERILEGVDTRANVLGLTIDELEAIFKRAGGSDMMSRELLINELREVLMPEDLPTPEDIDSLGDELQDEVLDRAEDRYEEIEKVVGEENMRKVEHWLLLESIDQHWREHLTAIEELRQSIGLQAYAQIDPLVAFKKEGYDMYVQLQENIRQQVARTVFKVKIVENPPASAATQQAVSQATTTNSASSANVPQGTAAPVLAGSTAPTAAQLNTNRGDGAPATGGGRAATATVPKLGRNDPCFCGSGKKFKKCHGAVA